MAFETKSLRGEITLSYYDDSEILIPEEALKLPFDKFIESYRILYSIACESQLLEIKANLQKYLDFIRDLEVIRNKYHNPQYLGTWELNEPDILREVWEVTKKIVYWDGKERHGPMGLSAMEELIRNHYTLIVKNHLETTSDFFSSISKNERAGDTGNRVAVTIFNNEKEKSVDGK